MKTLFILLCLLSSASTFASERPVESVYCLIQNEAQFQSFYVTLNDRLPGNEEANELWKSVTIESVPGYHLEVWVTAGMSQELGQTIDLRVKTDKQIGTDDEFAVAIGSGTVTMAVAPMGAEKAKFSVFCMPYGQ